ncbi:hypothetical protein [Nocardiopsis halophila]|uniref:hypothetical protein n=1 Tax=Nocardiopsis halophila TaxID=141692 RepID=UPI00034BE095|nr:hypothetical protein [Nocardiopsis halophila]
MPEPFPPTVLTSAREAIASAGRTRMHTWDLATALGLSIKAVHEQLSRAGVHPLPFPFPQEGVMARGFDLADIDAAIAAENAGTLTPRRPHRLRITGIDAAAYMADQVNTLAGQRQLSAHQVRGAVRLALAAGAAGVAAGVIALTVLITALL